MTNFKDWKDGEFVYCSHLVAKRGDDSFTHNPKTIATYLRSQASDAFADREYEISARLRAAASAINEDARTNHLPDWARANEILNYMDKWSVQP